MTIIERTLVYLAIAIILVDAQFDIPGSKGLAGGLFLGMAYGCWKEVRNENDLH